MMGKGLYHLFLVCTTAKMVKKWQKIAKIYYFEIFDNYFIFKCLKWLVQACIVPIYTIIGVYTNHFRHLKWEIIVKTFKIVNFVYEQYTPFIIISCIYLPFYIVIGACTKHFRDLKWDIIVNSQNSQFRPIFALFCSGPHLFSSYLIYIYIYIYLFIP